MITHEFDLVVGVVDFASPGCESVLLLNVGCLHSWIVAKLIVFIFCGLKQAFHNSSNFTK